MGLYRLERPRSDPTQPIDPQATLTPAAAQELLGVDAEAFAELLETKKLQPLPAGGFSHPALAALDLELRAEYQAWAPTMNLDFHKPARFGVIEFQKP